MCVWFAVVVCVCTYVREREHVDVFRYVCIGVCKKCVRERERRDSLGIGLYRNTLLILPCMSCCILQVMDSEAEEAIEELDMTMTMDLPEDTRGQGGEEEWEQVVMERAMR